MDSLKKLSGTKVLIIAAGIVVAIFVIWKVWDLTHPMTPLKTEPQSEEINTKADLDKADKALNDTDIDGDESQQFDNEVSF